MQKYYPMESGLSARLYEWIREEVPADAHILDVGAGAGGKEIRNLKPFFSRLCGVDIDTAVLDNPYLHEAKLLNADFTIPYPDASFDAAFSDFVFEHLEYPNTTLSEVARVLKPGGKLFYRTLNRWHYLCVLGRCMPRRLSAWLAHRLGHEPAGAARTHETWYRLNSRTQIRHEAAAAGLRVDPIQTYETAPVYFRLFAPAWYLGMIIERVANACPLFAIWRINIYGYLEKPPTDTSN